MKFTSGGNLPASCWSGSQTIDVGEVHRREHTQTRTYTKANIRRSFCIKNGLLLAQIFCFIAIFFEKIDARIDTEAVKYLFFMLTPSIYVVDAHITACAEILKSCALLVKLSLLYMH